MMGHVEVSRDKITVDGVELKNCVGASISVLPGPQLPIVTLTLIDTTNEPVFVGTAVLKPVGAFLTSEDLWKLDQMWETYADLDDVLPEDAKWLLERFRQLRG